MGIFLEMYKRELEENNEEISLMEGSVYIDDKIYIYVKPDVGRNFQGHNAYFKVYKGGYNNHAEMNRICLFYPEYVTHNSNTKEIKWYLSSKERKYLVKSLNKKSKNYPNLTVYQSIFKELELFGIYLQAPENMPDYNLLPEKGKR